MGRLRTRIMLALAASMLAACREPTPTPSPLGTLTPAMLEALAADCELPIIQERVCGRAPPSLDCQRLLDAQKPGSYGDTTHATATTRVWCMPVRGWSIWTDDHQRILGVCVDDVSFDAPAHEHAERAAAARQFYFKYFPRDLASVFAKWLEEGTGRSIPDGYPNVIGWNEPVGRLYSFPDPKGAAFKAHMFPGTSGRLAFARCWEVKIRK